MNSRSEKSVFLGHPNTFYCVCSFGEKNNLRAYGSTDLTWKGFVMKREGERVICVASYSIVTLQPPVEAATHLTLLLLPTTLERSRLLFKDEFGRLRN